MKHPIVIPHLGATGGDVRIIEWLVAEGQAVKVGEALFVVETDKATSEVEAFRDGIVSEVLKGAGAECAPGDVVALLTEHRQEALNELVRPSEPQPPVVRRNTARIRLKLASGAPAQRPAANPPTYERQANYPVGAAERLIEAFRAMTLIRRYEEHLYQLFLQDWCPGRCTSVRGRKRLRSAYARRCGATT